MTLSAASSAPTSSWRRPLYRLGQWWTRHSKKIAIVAVAVNLLLTGGYAILLGEQLRFGDERDYVALARSLAEGEGYTSDGGTPTAFRPPGYPLLLLPAYLATDGSVLAMRWVGVLALAGSVWLAYLLGRRTGSAAAGALAAVLMAGYPLLIYTASTLYPQVPALFLLLLTIELGLRATPTPDEPPPRRRWVVAVLAGAAAGLLILTVPTFGPSVALVIGWLAWRHRRRATRQLAYRAVAVLMIMAAVPPAAWCVRNALQLGAFVPVATNTGVNLLLGNSEGVTAGGGRVGDISRYENHAIEQDLDEIEQNHFYTRAALDWIVTHPADAATLYVGKVLNTFSFRNELATTGQADPLKDLVSALTYYPILVLAVLRLLLARRWPMHALEKVSLILILVNIAVLAVFFTRLRLRLPLDGLTILLAAAAVVHLLPRRDQRELSRDC